MAEDPKTVALTTGRLRRFASLARAGIGTAKSMAFGSAEGIEHAVERLGELRGIGTKVGQMAGLVEANLPPELRATVGPALAKLRDHAATSPYEAVAQIVLEDLGGPPEQIFATFERKPFASASLGQVHRATHHDGRALAVKVQHPGIEDAFRGDLQNVTSLGRVAVTFFMPDGQGARFIDGVKDGFFAELDYVREAENLRAFAVLVQRDPELEMPDVAEDVSSARVLSTTFLRGETVEHARTFPIATRARQAAAVRRFVISALCDHGLLYADAHAGNFLFRDDGTVGVLDFGSAFRFDEPRTLAFASLRDAALARDEAGFERAVSQVFELTNEKVARAIASVQWLAFGALVRGEAVNAGHVRKVIDAAGEMKKKLFGQRFAVPFFLPFLMRTLVATTALVVALDAPDSGPVGRL